MREIQFHPRIKACITLTNSKIVQPDLRNLSSKPLNRQYAIILIAVFSPLMIRHVSLIPYQMKFLLNLPESHAYSFQTLLFYDSDMH